MFKRSKKNKSDRVIKLVYRADTSICPDCGTHKESKSCPVCKKINKLKKNHG